MKRYILVFLMTISFCHLYSAEEKSINVKTAKDLYNSSLGNNSYPLNVKDNKYNILLTSSTTWGFRDKNYEGVVRLKINHVNTTAYDQYEANVTFVATYNYFSSGGVLQLSAPVTFSLDVTHDPLSSSGEQIDMQEYHIPGAFNIDVRIAAISYTNGYTAANSPENLVVEAETKVERNYDFLTSNAWYMGWNLNNHSYDLDLDGANDELEVYWSYIPGAEEYELEWTFVNEYEYQNNLTELRYSFTNNATKVRIKENYYRIPLVFDEGYVIYRVRAVGLASNWEDEEISGWAFASNENDIWDIINASQGNNVSYYHCLGHELNKNWQYIATYAEEGKNKAVVNYMDNTFRSRQQVTKTNTNSEAIAGETIYDFQGRAAISVLPVPTGKQPIKFYPDFNMNTNGAPYFWGDFDIDAGDPCNVITPIMATSSGASKYYSPQNPDIALPNTNIARQQGAIPDAKGYPFIQTEYEPDNTGKIRRQGGAGEEFQLSQNGHYTSYLYAQPSQTELDRLFGSEVGYKEHYQKNAIVDPNGQVSVSYIDMYGKVIATALAGVSPDSLMALESNSDPFPINEDLLATSNTPTLDSMGVEFTKTFIVTKDNTRFDYHYNLNKNQFNECIAPLCYTCVYDLSLTLVSNSCATTIINHAHKIGTIDSLCSSGADEAYDTTVMLNIGSYTLTKTLTLSQNAIDTYATWYIDSLQTNCFNPVLPEVPDSNGCCWTCTKCKESLQDSTAYFANLHDEFPDWNTDSIRSYYKKQVKLCKQMCERPSDCEITYNTMLSDVSPNGQYAQYREAGTGKVKPNLFPVSVLNTANVLPGLSGVLQHNWRYPYTIYLDQYGDTAYINIDADGSIADPNAIVIERLGGHYIRPEGLANVTLFAQQYWQPSFAHSLVPYHPEYYYYLWCGRNDDAVGSFDGEPISSNEFDRILSDAPDNAETYAVFNGKGFFGDNINSDNINLSVILDKDPFFKTASGGNGIGTTQISSEAYYYLTSPPTISGKELMMHLLKSYKRTVAINNQPNLCESIDIAAIAWMTHNCPPAYYGNSTCNAPPAFKGTGFNEGKITPQTFKTYFSLYLMCKKKVQEVLADQYSKAQKGFINQELPPFTMKPRGMFTPFYYEDDPSVVGYYLDHLDPNPLGFECTDFNFACYEMSEYYNTFKNDLIYPAINPTIYTSHPEIFYPNIPVNSLKNFWCTSHNDNHHVEQRITGYNTAFPRIPINSFNPQFANKDRRFPKLNDSYGTIDQRLGASGDSDEELMADMQRKADLNWYKTTGQCPLARDLEMFLSNIANFHNINANSTYIGDGLASSPAIEISSSYFSKTLYDTLLGSTSSTSPMDICTWEGSAGGGTINGNIKLGTTLKLMVSLSGLPTGITWDKVIAINQLTVIGPTSFTVMAKYKDAQGLLQNASLSGSITNYTPVNIDLYNCASLFDDDCNTSEEVKTLTNVLTIMTEETRSHTTINNTPIPAHFVFGNGYISSPSDQPLSDLILTSKLKRYLYDPTATFLPSPNTQALSYAVEKNTISTTPLLYRYIYKIKNNNNTAEMRITIDANADIPEGYFYKAKHVSGTNNQFEVKFKIKDLNSNPVTYTNSNTYTATVDYEVSYTTPTATTIPLDFDAGECAPIVEFSCRTPYHQNFNELQKLVKSVIKAGKLTHNFYLFPGSYVPDYLLSQFGNYYDLQWRATVINDTIFVNLIGNNATDTLCSLWFANNVHPISPATTPYTILTDISGFILHPQFNANNLSSMFQFTASGTSPSFTMNGFVSCMKLSDCLEPCPPNTINYTDIIYECDFENNNGFTSDYIYKGTINTPTCQVINGQLTGCNPPLNSGDYILTKYLYGGCMDSIGIYEPIHPNIGHFMGLYNATVVSGMTLWEKNDIAVEIGSYYQFSFDFYNCARQQNSIFKVFINGVLQSSENITNAPNQTSSNYNENWRTITLPPWSSGNNTLADIRIEYNNQVILPGIGYFIITGLDNVKFAKGVPCNTPFNPFPTPPPDSTKYDCIKTLGNIAANNAYQQNQQMLDSMRADFILKYKRKCLQTIESLYEATINPEYHYTLYYYDQAGMLLKTVPPEGVNPYTDPGVISNIKNERITTGGQAQSYFPEHRMATVYTYNSLNQLIKQNTPDAGITQYWYDKLGRIILSQNAKQRELGYYYSYTFYDEIGRIVEVGEVRTPDVSDDKMMYDYDNFKDMVLNNDRTQITATRYDIPLINNWTGTLLGFTQDNLRNRVAAVSVYKDNADLQAGRYIHATHYSYDIHGNVKTIIQDFPSMASYGAEQQFKRIDYKYDLISGKVNQVEYQKNENDKFYHRYEYDADNRLTHVFTSNDGITWEKEAKYWYYKHGPLARTEIGDLEVQGMDYAYTLQGWVKGINSNILDAAKDLGRDSYNILHGKFASDATAYSLNYFREDYIPIDNNFTNFTASIANIDQSLVQDAPGLYNGNISHMVTTIKDGNGAIKPQLTAYRYDQLNRIKQMRAYYRIDMPNNIWDGDPDNTYAENYTYDANGNIKTLERYDAASTPEKFDNLVYAYNKDANDNLINNRLRHVNDDNANTPYCDYDIDNQGDDNYTYDAIGNLTKDLTEEIDNIEWNVYGKIKEIIRTSGSNKPNLEFIYDAMGNRVCKIVKPAGGDSNRWEYTFYVRDAQGNIITTYMGDYEKHLTENFILSEIVLYGSSRIGIKQIDKEMSKLSTPEYYYQRTLGLKRYEISNHLGNVLTTFSDQKKETQNGGLVTGYTANIMSSQDYYPFGMAMEGRGFNEIGSSRGFNGQEKDREIYNNGNTYTATFWEYDARIGRRWNLDPVPQVNMSDYSCFGNNPISMIDPNGDVKDWFENEKTGEVMNVKGTSQLPSEEQNKGWVNIGKDDKFGEQNIPEGQDGNVTKMNTKNSKEFMSNQGFSLVPKQIFKYTNSNPQKYSTGPKSVTIEQGSVITINEKFTYVGKEQTAAHEDKNLLFESDYSFFRGSETYERLTLNYSKPTTAKSAYKVISDGNKLVQAIFGGKHDYKHYKTFGSWGEIPRNHFLNKYRLK